MIEKKCAILQPIGIVVFLIFPFWNASFAQCLKDVDCKGDRICVEGECREPNQFSPIANITTPTEVNEWSTGAGVSGLIISTVASSFGIVAAANEGVKAEVLGGISLAILGIDVPISAAGSRSARQYFTDGLPALRIISWVTYAASLGCGIGMISTGIAGGDVPAGLITFTVVSQAISGFGMAADALVSGAQARQTARSNKPTISLSFAPIYKGVKAGVQINFYSIQ